MVELGHLSQQAQQPMSESVTDSCLACPLRKTQNEIFGNGLKRFQLILHKTLHVSILFGDCLKHFESGKHYHV